MSDKPGKIDLIRQFCILKNNKILKDYPNVVQSTPCGPESWKKNHNILVNSAAMPDVVFDKLMKVQKCSPKPFDTRSIV